MRVIMYKLSNLYCSLAFQLTKNYLTSTRTIITTWSVINFYKSRASIVMGQRDTSPNIWTGGTLSRVSPTPIFEESSQVNLSLYLLISWHFISPKRIFYFNVDKEASASASVGLHPPSPPTRALPLYPAGGLPSSRPPAMSPQPWRQTDATATNRI